MTDTTLEEQRYDFDLAFQRKIVTLMLRDTKFAMKSKDLIKPEYFTEAAAGAVIALVQEHLKVYRAAPDPKIVPAMLKDAFSSNRIRPDMKDDVKAIVREALQPSANLSASSFVHDKVRDFARHQAVEHAIMASLPALEKGKWGEIEKLMKQALAVGSNVDGDDYDYWAESAARMQLREDENAGLVVKRGITTGYKTLDDLLYHNGWGRQELSCMMGAAKAGKSMSLGDFGKNASLAGHNVLYISCEVSARIISERLDAAIADVAIRSLNADPRLVHSRIQAAHARAGEFRLRDAPSGTLKPSSLHRMLDDYRDDGIIFDEVIVDYADIMAAEYRSDKLQDNLRSIYIDLRAIAHEMDTALLTATQTNRDGAKSMTAQATDVGDDFNKVRTVDLLIGINASEEEKKKGLARLYWAASRNSADGMTVTIRQDRDKMQFIKNIIGVSGGPKSSP